MATRVAARRLVVDGRHHIDGLDAVWGPGIAHPGVFGGPVPDGVFAVTTRTNLAGRTRHARLLSRIGREHKPAFTVKHPNAIDSLLVGDHAHNLVRSLAVVIEHGVPRGACDAARELVCAENHGLDQLFFLGSKIQVATNAADRHDEDRERKNQFGAKFSWHSGALPSLSAVRQIAAGATSYSA